MAKALASGGIALPVIAALVLGPGAFAVALAVIGVVVLVDLSAVLSGAAARPILPAALIPAVGLPAAVAVWPEAGWDLVPPFIAVAFLSTFLFALLFGRRRGIVQGAGTTMLAGLVVGLGGASLALLRGLPHGFRWALAFVVVVAAADLGGALSGLGRRGRRAAPADQHDQHVAGPVLLALVAAGALFLTLRPPLQAPVLALLTLAAVTAAVGGGDLLRNLLAEADADTTHARPGKGTGVVLAAFDGLLLGAPVAYVLARSAAL